MTITERLREIWIYLIAITVISTSAITWGAIQNLVVSPIRDDLTRQSERIKQLEGVLSQVKNQYDIPDTVLYDFSNANKELSKANAVNTLTIIEQKNLNTSVKTTIIRNQTTQINYSGFVITMSIANINSDGETIFNIGYIIPSSEIPESLQIKLYPAQTMTIMSSESTKNLKMFYISLIASDPSTKNALIEVSPLQALRDILTQKNESIERQKMP